MPPISYLESKPNPLREVTELFKKPGVAAIFFFPGMLHIKEKRKAVSWLEILNYHYFSFLITFWDQATSLHPLPLLFLSLSLNIP